MLEVFNAVGATMFKEMLEGREVAVARPKMKSRFPRTVGNDTVALEDVMPDSMFKNDDTVVMTRDDLNKMAQTETWDKLLGPDE